MMFCDGDLVDFSTSVFSSLDSITLTLLLIFCFFFLFDTTLENDELSLIVAAAVALPLLNIVFLLLDCKVVIISKVIEATSDG